MECAVGSDINLACMLPYLPIQYSNAAKSLLNAGIFPANLWIAQTFRLRLRS